jgi:hypothetical protein
MSKIIRYKIVISKRFLSYHRRAGIKTFFEEKIMNHRFFWTGTEGTRLLSVSEFGIKIHTIRNNYDLWLKRIEKVYEGKAVIDLCYWMLPGGRFTPGNELITFLSLNKDSGCGLQKITFSQDYFKEKGLLAPMVDNKVLDILELSYNDGLDWIDFKEWFKGYNLKEPMTIIHFTSFRY